MDPLVLLLSQLTVFGALFLLGLPGRWIHPLARKEPKEYLALLGGGIGTLFGAALLAALLGYGAVAWVLWAIGLAFVAVLDVAAVRSELARRHRRRKVRPRPVTQP
ncbi:MAG TPA: hypothetical protein VF062_22285 [Candidatus Limnocylindrales bacterium]